MNYLVKLILCLQRLCLHQIMCVPFMVSWILLNTAQVMVMQVSKSDQVDLIPEKILLSVVYQRSLKDTPITVVQHETTCILFSAPQYATAAD